MKKLLILALSLIIAIAVMAESTTTSEPVLKEKTEQSLLQNIEE